MFNIDGEMYSTVIELKNITKSYSGKKVLDNVNLSVNKGEIFGLLGPNGAGKSTLISIILGLKSTDSGKVSILGYNPLKNPTDLNERIGVQLESSTIPGLMKVKEALELFSSFFSHPVSIEKIIDTFELTDYLNYKFGTLSKGWKQRLEIALALIGNPEVVFLDEPTSGLDPHIKEILWNIFLSLRNEGKTLFLCTHYIEEAEKLCDEVSIIHRGKIVVTDSPSNLIRDFGFKEKVTIYKKDNVEKLLKNVFFKDLKLTGENGVIYTNNTREVIGKLEELKVDFAEFKVARVNLNDVFLKLTGKEITE